MKKCGFIAALIKAKYNFPLWQFRPKNCEKDKLVVNEFAVICCELPENCTENGIFCFIAEFNFTIEAQSAAITELSKLVNTTD